MTKRARRQRPDYRVRDWSPAVQNWPGMSVDCDVLVVPGDVELQRKWRGTKLLRFVDRQQPLPLAWWLPARVIIQADRLLHVVDVDLVPHTSERQLAAYHQRVRANAHRSVGEVSQPAAFTLLWVQALTPAQAQNPRNVKRRVVGVRQVTDRYALHVTQVQVRPSPSEPGARGQRAVPVDARLVVNDLRRVALDQVKCSAVLYPPTREGDVGLVVAGGQVARGRAGRRVRQRMVLDDETLRTVRDIHQAAPYGQQVQAVMAHFECGKSNANQLIRKSKQRLGWGLRHGRID